MTPLRTNPLFAKTSRVEKGMRILIQDQGTGRYVDDTEGWTDSADDARDFPSSGDAMTARVKLGVTNARLVFRFDREGHSIAVPLEPIGPIERGPGETQAQSIQETA